MNPLATIYRSRAGNGSGKSDSPRNERPEAPVPAAAVATEPLPVATEMRPVDRDKKIDSAQEPWKRQFLDKLSNVQSRWAKRFEEVLDAAVTPAFNELSGFLRENGFTVSTPMRDEGRRSFKFELIENAYLLMIFRCTSVGAFELRNECFVPGSEPNLSKQIYRISEINEEWARQRFQVGLNNFVELLAGKKDQLDELVTV